MAFNLTRRLFLRGAAITAPMLAIPAAAAVASSYVEENPVLLALGPEIDAADARLLAANASYEKAMSIANRLWPRASDELVCGPGYIDGDMERDITGTGYGDRRYIRTLASYQKAEAEALKARGPGSRKRRELANRRLELATAYEADKQNARVVSGYQAAADEQKAALNEVKRLVQAAHDEPGVAVKAKAIRAWGHAPKWERLLNLDGRENWAPDLARTLLETLEA